MAVVRNIQNNDLYRYNGENVFVNLRTGVSGVIGEELASKVFVINLEATEIIGKYPIIEDLIRTLNLKFCKDD